MTHFVKTWLDAAAAAVSAFAGVPFIPAESGVIETDKSPVQLALPLGGTDRRSRLHSTYTQQAKAA